MTRRWDAKHNNKHKTSIKYNIGTPGWLTQLHARCRAESVPSTSRVDTKIAPPRIPRSQVEEKERSKTTAVLVLGEEAM